ncbi:hypothetical protein RFZ01_03490, partial [Acinetobacter pittii]|uniref:hypothetical protein n=1 Tax=Acinetobacter pittii TaxID=48296 RepID=UPI002813243F
KFSTLLGVRTAFSQAAEAHAIGSSSTGDPRALSARQRWTGIFSFDDLTMSYLVKCESACGEDLVGSAYACRVLAEIEASDERA